MATDETPIEELEEDSEASPAASIDESTVKGWVREAIEDVLSIIPGEGSVKPPKDLDEEEGPLTLRQIEAASRRAVEEAMKPLRAALEAKPKPRKPSTPKLEGEAAAKPEAEATPANPTVSKIRKLMWGE